MNLNLKFDSILSLFLKILVSLKYTKNLYKPI